MIRTHSSCTQSSQSAGLIDSLDRQPLRSPAHVATPRVLLVATSRPPAHFPTQRELGRYPRIDYLEACHRLGADYIDYDSVPRQGSVEALENWLRLDLRLALKARELVRTHGYDVVVSMSERVGIPLALLLARDVRHVVIPCHPLSPFKLRSTQLLGLTRRWDSVLALTLAEAVALRQVYTHSDVKVWPRWVDTDFYGEVAGCAPHEHDYILSVGLSYRDYPLLFHVMRALPGVRCRIRAGSTWVDGHVNRDRMPPNIEVEDMARPDILRDEYQGARFVVVPIRPTTQWSAGVTTVLEAQAMGKAVITVRTPGMSDYVLDGETGLLVEPRNPAAFAEAVRELWNDPARARAMGARARTWVEERFSLERWLDGFVNYLHGRESVPACDVSPS